MVHYFVFVFCLLVILVRLSIHCHGFVKDLTQIQPLLDSVMFRKMQSPSYPPLTRQTSQQYIKEQRS